MAQFDFDGRVEIAVVNRRSAARDVRIRPLSRGLKSEQRGDTAVFALDRPENLSIEFGGDIFHNLHLFANPLDTRRPKRLSRRDKSLIYFAPGVHRLPGDSLLIPSGATVCIDGGARVYGRLIVRDAHDISICGRGEVHPEGRGAGISVERSHDVSVDGVILTRLPVGESRRVRVTNVKAVSSYGWGDGMNVFAASDISYDRVFCRNSDDCTTVYATRKGFTGSSRNVTMTRSVLWADVAHPIMTGLHGNVARPDTIERIEYDDIDILDHCEGQTDYQGCLAISCGDDNLVSDITFRNIRIEDFRQGQLVNFRIFYNRKYCLAPGRGIRNVLLKDVAYTGSRSELSIIAGYDDQRRVSGITFDNLTINGVHICDTMPGKLKWWKTADLARIFIGEHTDGIEFK